MSGQSAKKSINWHTGWLGEKDANGDLVGDWAHYVDKEQFRCRYCDVERKYTNGGRASLIAHSESEKHRKIAVGEKGIKEGRRRGEGKIGDKRKGEGGNSQKRSRRGQH